MDPEKSSNSSFEDIANLNDGENGATGLETVHKRRSSLNVKNNDNEQENNANDEMDIIGNGQIVKKIIKKGNSTNRPQARDFVKINYTATLENGVVVEEEKDLEIQVGDFEVNWI